MDYVLAQVNIGRLRAPLDSPQLAGFVAALDPVNAAADAAPGFVWRLQTEDGNATSVRAFEWDQARQRGGHRQPVGLGVPRGAGRVRVLRHPPAGAARRRQWFERMTEAYTALWWIPRGTVPSPADAEDRVRQLRAHGPTADAFTLRVLFPPPGEAATPRRGGRTGPAPSDRARGQAAGYWRSRSSSSWWIRSSATAMATNRTSSWPGATSTP